MKKPKKLSLDKQTIRSLQMDELAQVNGGSLSLQTSIKYNPSGGITSYNPSGGITSYNPSGG
jgi:hypothetical protein